MVNYIADVLPLRRRFVVPFCVACDEAQPIWNYLIWPRRCPHCGHRRAWRVWAVEVIYIVAMVWLWLSPPVQLGFIWGGVVLIYFGVVVVIDLEYRLIMHPVSIFGAVLGLGIGIYLNGLMNTLIGGVIGFGVLWLLYVLGELAMRMAARARGEAVNDVALGFGDVNLSGVLGLMLGWPAILLGLLFAVFLGGAVSLVYLIAMVVARRYRLFMALPYGPYLVSGAIILLYFRDAVIHIFGG